MKYILILLFIVFSINTYAQQLPEMPNPPRLVNDFAGILSTSQVRQLENELTQFNNQTSTQIAVAIVPSLDGTSVDDYAVKLALKWKIGQAGKNNGILVLIKPKVGNQKGHAFIATGYGLEGAVPDAVANRIVNAEMIPSFKNGDYFGGISKGVTVLQELTRNEYTADEYLKRSSSGNGSVFIIVLLMVVFIVISSKASSKRNTSYSSRGVKGSALPFWILMSGLGSSSRSSGGFSGFSSGSGGFGGFGGGSFGGGGAGGSW